VSYSIIITHKARKFIDSQPKAQQIRLLAAINLLPDVGDIRPLSGYAGVFRLRVGGFRVIYTKQEDILRITVVNAGSRGQIYKDI